MTILMLLWGVAALALPGVRPRPLLVSHPRWFVRLAVTSIVVGIACVVISLVLSVTVATLRLVVPTPTLISHLAPEGAAGAGVALVLLVWTLSRGALVVKRARRGQRLAHVDRWIGEHHGDADGDVIVVPTAATVAYSIPGREPQIVISEGLCNRLDDDIVRFVIDHERAHLRAKDRRPIVLAGLVDSVFGSLPFVTRSTVALRVAVERAADEEAAGLEPARRRRIAEAIGRQAGALGVACGPELVRFRVARLATIAPAATVRQAAAVVGVGILTVGAVSVAVHAGADVSPYLALLR